MLKAIRVHMFQQMPNYRKPASFLIRETFPLPPYSSVIGMVHSACGFDSYHSMKVSIQGSSASEVNNLETMHIKDNNSTDNFNKKTGKYRYTYVTGNIDYEKGTIEQSQIVQYNENEAVGVMKVPNSVQLLTDVELYIHILPENPEDFDKILNGLRSPNEYISLGRREDIARIDEVEAVELDKIDVYSDESVSSKFSAYLPVDYISKDDEISGENIGTVYKVTKEFEIVKDKRIWKNIVSARFLPPEKEILDSVAEHENVYYDTTEKLPVFFA